MGEEPTRTAYFGFHKAVYAGGGKLDKKSKELVALAVASAIRCEYCVDSHSQKARVAGASVEEMKEVVYIAASICAGAALAHGSRAWKSAEEKTE